MNPHMNRWITGVIAVPILFSVIAYGSETLFSLLIMAVTLIGIAEYNRMSFGTGCGCEKSQTIGGALLVLLAAAAGDVALLAAFLTFAVLAVLMLNLLRTDEGGPEMTVVGKLILGILYIPLLMSHFILLRQTPDGVRWIFFILVLAFVGDIAAYYVGRGMGKRKLLPRVSPGKTVEGTIGLFAGSVAGVLIFSHFFLPALGIGHAALMGFVGGIAGQLGDLSESALKRSAGVKDSGTILPGHGGILDRLDCLMFIAPFVYFYRVFIVQ
jgi:phosphatidate cytidylyltransferase